MFWLFFCPLQETLTLHGFDCFSQKHDFSPEHNGQISLSSLLLPGAPKVSATLSSVTKTCHQTVSLFKDLESRYLMQAHPQTFTAPFSTREQPPLWAETGGKSSARLQVGEAESAELFH